MNSKNVLGYIFLAIGLLLLVMDLFVARSTSNFISASEKAKGVVIRNDYVGGSRSASYRPIVRFVTAKGRTVEFASGIASSPPSYNESDEVEVLYNPENPQKAEINDFISMWLIVMILTFIGTIFSGVGLLVLKFATTGSMLRSSGYRDYGGDDFNSDGD